MPDPHEEPVPWNAEAQIACAFSFQCPKTWNRLATTSDPTVRHCSVCDRAVHLALTEEDFRGYSAQGRCVAVPIIPQTRESQTSEVFMVGRGEEAPYFSKVSPRKKPT